jgi:acyl-CoA synthetase (NDP forming)
MLTERMKGLLENSKEYGWVLEPDTKTLFAEWGLPVPRFCWAKTIEEALNFAGEVGYPVVAKIVSPKIIHKSDVRGVIIGIKDEEELRQAYTRLEKQKGFLGILVGENLPQWYVLPCILSLLVKWKTWNNAISSHNSSVTAL